MKLNLLFIGIMFLSISCSQKETEKEKTNPIEIKNVIFNKFPDEIEFNTEYEGELTFKSELDTIELKDGDSRFTFLYITTENGNYETIEDIENTNHNVFIEFTPKKFKFKFKMVGTEGNFTGIIKDMVILSNYTEDGKARILTNLILIKRKFEFNEEREKTAYNTGYNSLLHLNKKEK